MVRVSWRERFWSKVDRRGECWEWIGGFISKNKNDQYGRFKIKGVTYKAHRISYAMEHNLPLKFDGLVLHCCDNSKCVRPSHLELGDYAKNNKDAYLRGRRIPSAMVGIKNPNAKLSLEDVVLIKTLIAEGKNNKQIAGLFAVGHSMISRIRLGKSWTTPTT